MHVAIEILKLRYTLKLPPDYIPDELHQSLGAGPGYFRQSNRCEHLAPQSMLCGKQSPESLLQMQNPKPHPRPTVSESTF